MTEDKTLLVLGASSEMGLALLKKVSGNYRKIAAHCNQSEHGLRELSGELGGRLDIVRADLSDDGETESLIKTVEEKIVCPTHIVHMPAGKVRYNRFYQSEWADMEKDLHIQLRSVYKILNRFIRPMSKTGGAKIVFVLTSNTVSAPKYMANYNIVKFALMGLMKSLAVEYADKSVMVNAVSPSMIDTKFISELPDAAVKQSAAANPAGRNAVVEDIIPAIEFLLSDGAGFITGQNITVSGGSVI